MARPRSERVEEIKAILARRLVEGHYRAGERFLSNRALAGKYGLSYQTADRLIRELCQEGYLERRAASGTYLPGETPPKLGAFLCFDSRSRRPGSIGERLLNELTAQLNREGIKFQLAYDDDPNPGFSHDWYPVLWEWNGPTSFRSGLLLHKRPASGMDSTFWDSVSVDDFSGGVCAAQVIRQRVTLGRRWVVVSGPSDDYRSQARVAGFRSLVEATVIPAGWFSEDGETAAPAALAANPDGIFFANDRLAEGFLRFAKRENVKIPTFVGFDNAPIAEEMNMTTIAIPWSELTLAATNTIRRRLTDQRGTGTHQVVAPRPIIRW